MVALWWEEMHRKTCFTKATRKPIFILANLRMSPWPSDPGCLSYKSTLCYHLEWEASQFTAQMVFYKELSDGKPTSLIGQSLVVMPATWTDQTETNTSFFYLSSNLNCVACSLDSGILWWYERGLSVTWEALFFLLLFCPNIFLFLESFQRLRAAEIASLIKLLPRLYVSRALGEADQFPQLFQCLYRAEVYLTVPFNFQVLLVCSDFLQPWSATVP